MSGKDVTHRSPGPGWRAAALALTCLAAAATPAVAQDRPAGGGAVLLSFGPDLGASGTRTWREGYATAEYRSDRPLWRGVRPLYGLALSRQGAVLATVGVHGVLRLGPVEVTPHFGLGLWQDGRGRFDGRELLQFRSGIDAFLPLSDRASVGLGYYHVSNAGITRRSADLDVIRLSLLWRL